MPGNTATYRFYPAKVGASIRYRLRGGDPLLSKAETFYDGHANLSPTRHVNGLTHEDRAYSTTPRTSRRR